MWKLAIVAILTITSFAATADPPPGYPVSVAFSAVVPTGEADVSLLWVEDGGRYYAASQVGGQAYSWVLQSYGEWGVDDHFLGAYSYPSLLSAAAFDADQSSGNPTNTAVGLLGDYSFGGGSWENLGTEPTAGYGSSLPEVSASATFRAAIVDKLLPEAGVWISAAIVVVFGLWLLVVVVRGLLRRGARAVGAGCVVLMSVSGAALGYDVPEGYPLAITVDVHCEATNLVFDGQLVCRWDGSQPCYRGAIGISGGEYTVRVWNISDSYWNVYLDNTATSTQLLVSSFPFNAITSGAVMSGTTVVSVVGADWGYGWNTDRIVKMVSYGAVAGFAIYVGFGSIAFITRGILSGSTRWTRI